MYLAPAVRGAGRLALEAELVRRLNGPSQLKATHLSLIPNPAEITNLLLQAAVQRSWQMMTFETDTIALTKHLESTAAARERADGPGAIRA